MIIEVVSILGIQQMSYTIEILQGACKKTKKAQGFNSGFNIFPCYFQNGF